MEISVTDTGVLDVDQDFIWTWLLNGNLLVFNGSASLLDDLRPLLLGDLRHGDGNGKRLKISSWKLGLNVLVFIGSEC